VEQQPALIDHHDLFEQAAELLDQVGGDDNRAGVFGIVGQQLLGEGKSAAQPPPRPGVTAS
jgi:hypothetical protein